MDNHQDQARDTPNKAEDPQKQRAPTVKSSRLGTQAQQYRLPKYSIGVVSQWLGISPQMLRRYEEAGLIEPTRQTGKNRLYSDQDVAALEEIADLAEQGINTAGIRHILQLRRQLQQLKQQESDPQEE
jgi:MerR family transcriptional regulator/heat shock protein HspR